MNKVSYFLFIIVLGVLLGLLFFDPTLNIANAWTTLVNEISLTEGSAETDADDKIPALCVDTEGNVHIVWKDILNGNSGIYYTKLNNKGEVLLDKIRVTDLSKHRNPDVAVDSNGDVHIVYQSGSSSYDGSTICYTRLDKDGNTVVPRKQISSYYDASWKQTPKIVVDSGDNVHVVWVLNTGSEDRIYYAYYHKNHDVINTSKVILSGVYTRVYKSPNDDIRGLNLAVDGNGDIHMAWLDVEYTVRYYIYYQKLSGDATILVDAKKLSPDDTELIFRFNPSLALDNSGNVYIAWEDWRNYAEGVYDYFDTYFTKLNNEGDTIIDNKLIAKSVGPQVGIDTDGNMYIVFGGYDGVFNYKKFDSKGNVIVDDAINTSSDGYRVYHSLETDSDDNIHIAWSSESPDLNEIYYIKGTGQENVEVVDVILVNGWNMISLNKQPEDTSIASVLQSISGKYTSVWAYIDGSWKVYDPENPGFSDLTTMEAGMGYWINMKESATLSTTGAVATPSCSLGSGWNLVGYNSSTSQAVADALESISDKYVSVWAYIDGSWKVYDPDNPGFSDLTTMAPSYGYWINTTEACTWTLP